LGRLAESNYEKIYTSAYVITDAVSGMKINDFTFDLQGENRSSLALAAVVESMITAFFNYLSCYKDIGTVDATTLEADCA
jgi:hypothetical protein